MPDVHWGIGATVGSVIPTRGAIIAAAVGVDIGCGMMAVETSLNARDLPDNLHGIREAIEKAVPVGRTDNRGKNDRGAWKDEPAHHLDVWAGAPFQSPAIGEFSRHRRAGPFDKLRAGCPSFHRQIAELRSAGPSTGLRASS
jgi:tRNA-splicing ligase RtcB